MNSLPLLRRYSAPFGKPEIDRVDPSIFTLRWFLRCMDCNFCHDACCQYGTGVDLPTIATIREHAPGLTPLVGVNAERWFLEGAAIDPDALGGQTRRTRIIDGACVFLNRPERGCLLHAYALQHGLSVNAMKPLYCRLFPLVVDHGQLEPESVAKDRSLICLGAGATLYQGQREELRALMGDDFVAEVDALEQQVLSVAPSDATGPTSGKRGKSLALVCNR